MERKSAGQARKFDLADLLTASGAAMAASNTRLAGAGAPALLREFALELAFDAAFKVPDDPQCGLAFRGVSKPNPQMAALFRGVPATVKLAATYVAAPSLVPVPPT